MKKTAAWLIPSLISGVLAGLAFPKFELAFTAWIALLPLLWVLTRPAPVPGFRAGWASGFLFYAVLLSWVPAVPKHYGGLSSGFSLLIFLLFALFLGIFWGGPAALFTRIRRRSPAAAVWIFPCLWVASEWILTHILTGFPWGLLGSSQYRNLWFIQLSAVTGVYGLSWVIVAFQSAAVASWRSRRAGPLLAAAVLAAVVHAGGFLSIPPQSPQSAGGFRVGVIQGNISADTEFSLISPQRLRALFDRHLRLSRDAESRGARLIIWPELSVPFCFNCEYSYYPEFERLLRAEAARSGATFLLGTNEVAYQGKQPLYYNTAACLSPRGDLSMYHKTHLVPFGEYTPYKFIFSFIGNYTQAIGELTPGTERRLHSCGDIPFGSPICYEIIFPSLVRSFTRRGARFLVTITNDAWYGTSAAPYQHFAMAVLRAVENRRMILRAATTGISGAIDPYGRIIKRVPMHTAAMLTADVIPRDDRTLYVRFGDLLPLLSLTISGGFLILALIGHNEKRNSKSRSRNRGTSVRTESPDS